LDENVYGQTKPFKTIKPDADGQNMKTENSRPLQNDVVAPRQRAALFNFLEICGGLPTAATGNQAFFRGLNSFATSRGNEA
jgi:hypothetical protein